MAQKQSPYFEIKYGWNLGESGWNTGMDENLVKLSFLDKPEVGGIVSVLPQPATESWVLTTDNRFYIAAGGVYYSCDIPTDFIFYDKSLSQYTMRKLSGYVAVESYDTLSEGVQAIENTIALLGSAAYRDELYFTTSAEFLSYKANAATEISFAKSGSTEVRTLANHINDQPKSVYDYGMPSDGVSDCTPALLRALLDTNNIYFPENSLGYTFITAGTAILSSDTQINFNGQATRFSASARIIITGQIIQSNQPPQTLQPRYSKNWVIQNAGDSRAGDLLFVNTTIQPSPSWADTKKDLVRISEVSGNNLTLEEGLNFAYTTSDTGIYCDVYRPYNLTLKNPNLIMVKPDSDATPSVMLDLRYLSNIVVESPKIKGSKPFNRSTNIYRVGIQFFKCWGASISNGVFEAMTYPLGAYGGSRNIEEIGTKASYCHHSHLDMGDWSSDYLSTGLVSSDAYQAINSHPALRVNVKDFKVKNDFGLSNMRCFGGSLENGFIETSSDDTQELAQYQNDLVNAGYEYLYSDADFTLKNVTYLAPNRITKPPVEIRNGRKVVVDGVTSPSFGVSAATIGSVSELIFGPNNSFGSRRTRGPTSNTIRSNARCDFPPKVDAYLASSIYHINLRESLVDHSPNYLKAFGSIFSGQPGEPKSATIRIHTNCFSGVSQVNNLIGKIKFIASVSHQNSGAFSLQEKVYNFDFKAGVTSALTFPTTAIYTSGLSGQTNESISLSISSTAFSGESQIGVNGDHYVDCSVVIASGRTTPLYNLSYEIEITRVE